MISCGEPSGDLYAGALATGDPPRRSLRLDHRLRRRSPARCRGDARRRLQRHFGDRPARGRARPAADVCHVPPPRAPRRRASVPTCSWRSTFPDFNFRLARAIRRLGIPVVYYISPQLWAWRPGRMKTMREIADRVLVIFEFEKADLRAGGRAGGVGRPSAARRHAAAGAARLVPDANAGLARRASGRGAPAGQPPQRAARNPAGTGRGRRADSTGDSRRPVRRRAGAAPRRRALRAARVRRHRRRRRRRRGPDGPRARGGRRGHRRLRDGHGAGGAARVPDGRGLSPVAD